MTEKLYECVGGPMAGTRMRSTRAYEVGQGFQFSRLPGFEHLDGVSYLLGSDGKMHYVDPGSGMKLRVRVEEN